MIQRNKRLAGIIQEAEVRFHIPVPPHIDAIKTAFTKHGKKLYVVGGAVRDAVLGKTPKDFDLATDAPPQEVSAILSSEDIRNIPKGEQFGVISAIFSEGDAKHEYEIATFRSESYEGGDGRRPTDVSFTDIAGDVSRRDLTINALYYDLESHMIIDLVGGYDDIKNKRIRAVGDPMHRFGEDRLRVLRALRFAHRFGSKLDDKTIQACIHFNGLPGVSNERIRTEFIAGLASAQHPEKYLEDYRRIGLFARTFPGVALNLKFVPGLRNYILVIANLLLPNKDLKAVRKCLADLKMQDDEPDAVVFLIRMAHYLSEIDAVSFSPEAEAKNIESLGKARDLRFERGLIGIDDMKQWGGIARIPQQILKAFLAFRPRFSAKDFPELQGRELGAAIGTANAEAFLKTL